MKLVELLAVLLVAGCICLVAADEYCPPKASGECEYQIAQSMPEGLDLKDPPGTTTVPTHKSLIDMVNQARESLSIASFYWWLTAPKEFDGHPSVEPGKQLMEAIKEASLRGVKLQVVLDHSGRKDMNNKDDLAALEQAGSVKFLNMTKLLRAGSGVVHTKFLIADNKTFYVGSSNFDWRSYTQIKEIGVSVWECPQLGQDLDKIFRTYLLMADQDKVPSELGDDLKTSINLANPLTLDDVSLFMGASPPPFNGASANGSHTTTGRTDDIEGLLHVINRAHRRVDISVMNYSPQFEFGWQRKYWPRIEDALRRAAIERRVRVRLLFSNWTSTKPLESVWYRSLNAIQSPKLRGGGIEVKLFRVPSFDDFQKSIPYARVKHDKYMVTERDLYVGTSNWAPDYFTTTCGVGMVFQPLSDSRCRQKSSANKPLSSSAQEDYTGKVVGSMQAIFERDFTSEYAHELDHGN